MPQRTGLIGGGSSKLKASAAKKIAAAFAAVLRYAAEAGLHKFVGNPADDCNPDRPNPYVSGTSLVPDSVLELMFAG